MQLSATLFLLRKTNFNVSAHFIPHTTRFNLFNSSEELFVSEAIFYSQIQKCGITAGKLSFRMIIHRDAVVEH